MTNLKGKRRLFMLLQGLQMGGLEMVVVNLVKGLPEAYDITVCCYDSLGPLEERIKERANVIFIPRKPGFDLSFIFKLRRKLRELKIDVLHAHNHTAFFYGTIAGKLAGVKKIIYTEHGRTGPLSAKAKLAHRFLAKFVDHAVVVADYLKEPLVREEGFRSDKVRFIPNGIDGSFYEDPPPRSELVDELGLDESNKLVGIVARLDPIKNHALLINAMKEVSERIPEARLIVAGDGPLRGELEQLTSELELKDVVIFMGERGDVPRILSGLDLFVLSSLSEGMSITLVEAMAAGLPIVVTDVGGNSLLVTSGDNGLLVPSDDRKAMSDEITRLLNDKELSQRLGKKARDRFNDEFTLHKMIEKHRQIYDG